MKRLIRTLAVCLCVLVPLTSCQWKSKTHFILHPKKTGIATVRFHDQERSRPLITEIWYPVDDNAPSERVEGLWVRCAEARDAPVKSRAKKYPLIMMSHGNGGDRTNNAWLAEILAANGYVVASVDHHGNTWNNTTPENFVKIWDRPKDVSSVVDQILQDSKFGPHIDAQKVGFIGYSLGGVTGVWIAGGQITNFEVPVVGTLPPDQIPPGVTDEMLSSIDFSPIKASYRDPRVGAVFLMAPALGYLFDLNSLQAISVPVYIVASEGDITVPLEKNAKILASKIKKVAFTLIPGSANHYVFLNEVTRGGKMLLAKHLANDPPNVNRGQIHEEIGEAAVSFFNEYLK